MEKLFRNEERLNAFLTLSVIKTNFHDEIDLRSRTLGGGESHKLRDDRKWTRRFAFKGAFFSREIRYQRYCCNNTIRRVRRSVCRGSIGKRLSQKLSTKPPLLLHVYTRSRFIDSLNYARNYENGIASPTSKIWIHCTHFIYRYLRYVLKFSSTTFPLFIRSCRYLFVARFKRASLTLIIRN